jgi:hypothetical protein
MPVRFTAPSPPAPTAPAAFTRTCRRRGRLRFSGSLVALTLVFWRIHLAQRGVVLPAVAGARRARREGPGVRPWIASSPSGSQ